jgi:hypothetical protein
MMGLQHTLQSSTYSWRLTEQSTTISIRSPQYGHWMNEL